MRVTLKKFLFNPKYYLRRAPVVIVINSRPEFAIIPYVTYKAVYENEKIDIHQNTITQHMQASKKKHSRLYRLLFG